MESPHRRQNGTPRPIKAAAMLFLPLLIAAVVACDSNSGGAGSLPTVAPTAMPPAAYADSTEGKPPNMGQPVPDPKEAVETKPAGELPTFLSQAGASSRTKITALYKGAADNYDAYNSVPCYCGCAIYMHPHKSLAECYIKQKNADGTIEYSDHSLSCDLCQSAAQMTMDGLAAKTPLKDIRAAIYQKLKYTGIWTDTPAVH